MDHDAVFGLEMAAEIRQDKSDSRQYGKWRNGFAVILVEELVCWNQR